MSYYATVSGTVTIPGSLAKDQWDRVENILKKTNYEIELYKDEEGLNVDFRAHEVYYEDEVERTLDELAAEYPVKPGSRICFVGEDNAQWAYEFEESAGSAGKWNYLEGKIAYMDRRMPDYDMLLRMFVDYVTNESERTGDPSSVTSQLEDVGCDAEMRKLLGLDYPEE